MRAYRYELLAVVLVLLGSILFSSFGISDGRSTLAETQTETDAEMVSLK